MFNLNFKMMKRGFLLKVLMSIAFAMFVGGLFAQIPAAFDPISGDNAVDIDSVTVGTTVPYWVEPDAYFHPNFASTGALTADFTWTWAVAPAGPTLAATNNYVEVTYGAATVGNQYNITVHENAPAAYGSCSSPDTNMYVFVVPEPTVNFTAGAGFINAASTERCEGSTDIDNEIVRATMTGFATFQLQWRLQIHTLEADHTTIDKYWDSDKTTELVAPGTLFAEDFDESTSSQVVNLTGTTRNLSTGGFFTCITDGVKRSTVYTYTLRGVNDRISRKSDYLNNTTAALDAWTWYDVGPKTVVIIVNPAPKTGPIYHIPNNWSL